MRDSAEARNLVYSTESARAILAFRRSILQVITAIRATLGIEPESLRQHRLLLKALIPAPELSGGPDPARPQGPTEPGGL